MPKWYEYLKPLGFGNPATPGKNKNVVGGAWSDFLTGTPGQINQVSNLRPDQEGLSQQLVNAGMQPGAGGAFGTAADYYRNLMSDENADINAFSAPALRQFNQDIMPGIAEQYATGGGGQGSFSSSGFRNAQVQAGTDLAERLGAIRANLRQSGAQGLQNIGQLGLQPFQQNYEQPGTPGLLSQLAPAAGTAVGTLFGGPTGGIAGNMAGNWLGNMFSGNKGTNVGAQSGPYGGGGPQASAQVAPRQPLPNLNWNMR